MYLSPPKIPQPQFPVFTVSPFTNLNPATALKISRVKILEDDCSNKDLHNG